MTIDETIAHARENYNEIINTTYNKCQHEHLSCDGCANPTCKEIADENLQIAEWLEELKELREYKKRMEMQDMDDINNPLEPLKLGKALESEIFKYNYRKEHKPQDINILDYTVMYALKHCLEEQLKAGGTDEM